MLIGIDASRATITQRTGTEGYSLHLITALIRANPEHQFRLYFRTNPPDNLFPKRDYVTQRIIEREHLWTHLGLGPDVRNDPPDVLFVPAHVIPWPGVDSVPTVVTLHDVGYIHYPDKHPFFERMYLNWSTRHSANVSTRIIAHSNATAHDLEHLYHVPQEKLSVVYSGVTELLRPPSDPNSVKRIRAEMGLKGPYILHVGRIEPRKNLVRLVEAYARLRSKHPDLKLVLAGRINPRYRSLKERILELDVGDGVLLPGYIPDETLPILYHGATVYAFPSLYEGFGFPVLEAMACGTAVVCANTSSLPELAGDAALMVPPTDVTALTEALHQVLSSKDLRDELVRKGYDHAASFTWESCAQQTMEVLSEAASIASHQLIAHS